MKKQLFILHMLFLPFICIPSSAADKTKDQTTLWEQAVDINTLRINEENIKTLNFDQIPETLKFNDICFHSSVCSNEQLKGIFEKVPNNKTIGLTLHSLTITKDLWDCISENAKKINHLDISFLKNQDTDFTLAWPNLLKKSNNDLEITLYDDLKKEHLALALENLFTELADNNELSNKKYTLSFCGETSITLPATKNKISSVKKLKFDKKFSIKKIKDICNLFSTEKLKEIEISTNETSQNFFQLIRKTESLFKILKECDGLTLHTKMDINPLCYNTKDGTLTRALEDKKDEKDEEIKKWKQAIKGNSLNLKINKDNIKTLDFDQTPKTFKYKKVSINSHGCNNEQLEETIKKIPQDKTIELYLSSPNITKKLWDCISENAKKISYLRISFLKNKDTDFTLAWPDLLKNSHDNLEIALYDDLNKKHLALQGLFTELADNQPSNKNYTLNLTFYKETNINLPPTKNKISFVKKLNLSGNTSLENVETICKLFNTEQLKKIEITTERTNEEFLNDIKENKKPDAILEKFDHVELYSTSEKKRKVIYKNDGSPAKALAGEKKQEEMNNNDLEIKVNKEQQAEKQKQVSAENKPKVQDKLKNFYNEQEQEQEQEQEDDEPEIEVIENTNKQEAEEEVVEEQEVEQKKEDTVQINQKWLTKKVITYSALALGASYLTYRLFFAKSKQPAINLKKNLSDNPQKIFTFIPSQQKNQLAIGKLRNK